MDLDPRLRKPLVLTSAVLALGASAIAYRATRDHDSARIGNVPTLAPEDSQGRELSNNELEIIERAASKEQTGQLSLLIRFKPRESDHQINVAVGEVSQTIHPQDFVDIVNEVTGFTKAGGQMSFIFPEENGERPFEQTYTYKETPEKNHYFVLSPYNEAFPATAFTVFALPRDHDASTVAILASTEMPTRFNQDVSGDHFNAVVEVCNSLATVNITEESFAQIQAYAAEKGVEFSDDEATRTVLMQVGQELTCNSLAAGISFAKSGVDYDTYKEVISRQQLSALGQGFAAFYAVVNKSTYESFAKTQFQGFLK